MIALLWMLAAGVFSFLMIYVVLVILDEDHKRVRKIIDEWKL